MIFLFYLSINLQLRLQRSPTLLKPAAVSQSVYQAEYLYSFISRSLFCVARVSHTRQRFLLAPFSLLGQSNCSGKKGQIFKAIVLACLCCVGSGVCGLDPCRFRSRPLPAFHQPLETVNAFMSTDTLADGLRAWRTVTSERGRYWVEVCGGRRGWWCSRIT